MLTFSGRKIAFFSGAAEALFLRQITTVGSTEPYYLHGFKRNPCRPGAFRKFSLRRAVKDNCFSADRFFYATPPAAVISWPIEIDLNLGNPLFEDFDWIFDQRLSAVYDASRSCLELMPCVIELYHCRGFNLRIVKSPLGYEVAHAVRTGFSGASSNLN